MTLALGTSSPVVSVALINPEGVVLGERHREARGAASGALALFVVELLAEANADRADITKVIVDIGPGSFTGVKVGVTFAKTLAWALKIPVFTVTSFDLISADRAVAVPSKKGEWYVRQPHQSPQVLLDADLSGYVGYGPGFEHQDWPAMSTAGRFLKGRESVDPYALVPLYVSSPSISIPKNPRFLPGGRP